MKKVLITGANSYIGTSVEKWLMKEPTNYHVDTIDMIDGSWKEKSFFDYDTIFHVAGIAHVSSDPKMEKIYYAVNCNLAIETARKAKAEGVKQFIFMSSIIVYADNRLENGIITKDILPDPKNIYGKSKFEAEKGLLPLRNNDFKVAILRPPMIYGKDCKGNYQLLVKLVKILPVFPKVKNFRSVLHIDNFCEFVKRIIDHDDHGTFFPQNKEYIITFELVKTIAKKNQTHITFTKIFNPLIYILNPKIKIINKVFGSFVYDKCMSDFDKNYHINTLEDSINKS